MSEKRKTNEGFETMPSTSEDRLESLREQAERVLRADAVRESSVDIADVKELIHQLNVYQIELELQNEELQTTQRSLEHSRDKYVKLFDFAPVGLVSLDAQALVKDINLAGARLLLSERSYVTGKSFIAYVAQPYHEEFLRFRAEAFNSRLPVTSEIKLVSRDGGTRYVELRSIVVEESLHSPREPLGLTAIVDLTARREMEEALVRAKDEAVTANRAKSDFLAKMSHELRTPLHGILGMTEVVMRTAKLPEEQLQYLRMAHSSGLALLALVNDILDLSKVEVGAFELSEAPVNLHQVVKEVLGPLRHQIEQKGISFSLDLSRGVPEIVIGDAARISQILNNLVGNALKFTETGEIRVALSRQAGGDAPQPWAEILVSVSDTGLGVPLQFLPRIFDEFYQADGSNSRRHEGSGLGLTIARHLVERMGGAIWAESQEGRGATFSFTIRVRLPKPQVLIEQASSFGAVAGRAEQERVKLPKLRILLVEDNPVNQTFAQLILRREGHFVVSARNGREALEALERESFNVVLMDVRMPEMDGVEATRRIRAAATSEPPSEIDPETPIIAMTAHALLEDEERFRNVGMDGYISKPVDWDGVMQTIHDVLSARGLLPEDTP